LFFVIIIDLEIPERCIQMYNVPIKKRNNYYRIIGFLILI